MNRKMNQPSRTITGKGLFLPSWVIIFVFSPVLVGGAAAITWTAKTLIDHGHKLIEIEEKIDSSKELMIEMVNSHERRIVRIEDKVFSN